MVEYVKTESATTSAVVYPAFQAEIALEVSIDNETRSNDILRSTYKLLKVCVDSMQCAV